MQDELLSDGICLAGAGPGRVLVLSADALLGCSCWPAVEVGNFSAEGQQSARRRVSVLDEQLAGHRSVTNRSRRAADATLGTASLAP